MGYINKEELSQELIDYLKSGSDGGNIDLEKTDNIKYNRISFFKLAKRSNIYV